MGQSAQRRARIGRNLKGHPILPVRSPLLFVERLDSGAQLCRIELQRREFCSNGCVQRLGSLGAFAVFDIWSANRRGAERSVKVAPRWQDLLLVATGAVVYVGILHGHGWLFGMPVAFSG